MDRDANEIVGPRDDPSGQAPAGRGPTRRQVLKYGLGGVALAGAGTAGYYLLRAATRAASDAAVIFKNDAPKGELWELWKQRGWVAEARYYHPLGRNVLCKVCPNECLLEPEDRGRCRNKVNKDGKLYTLAYGNPCSFHTDPIEKKPLYHFLPGTKVFSIATSGCGFRCMNCQNWDISQRKPEELKDPRGEQCRMSPDRLRQLIATEAHELTKAHPELSADDVRDYLMRRDLDRLSMFPDDVVGIAEMLNSPSISYTYSEPTSYYEYMLDTAKLARQKKIKNVWVTCGYIQEKPLLELCDYLDAATVDLKSFDDAIYRKLNSGKLQPILDTLKTVKKCGVWLEVSYLVVPTYTDDKEMLRRMCGWLVENIGTDYPLHFLRFHPAHKLNHLPPTPVNTLQDAGAIAKASGLRHVYLGNVPGVKDAGTTFCPGCGKPVIERDVFAPRSINMADGKCKFCGAGLLGVWSA